MMHARQAPSRAVRSVPNLPLLPESYKQELVTVESYSTETAAMR
jgi:hypothetical protein